MSEYSTDTLTSCDLHDTHTHTHIYLYIHIQWVADSVTDGDCVLDQYYVQTHGFRSMN